MESWRDEFEAIEACIVVSEGLNDLSTEKFENIQCGCRPSFAGEKICKDNRCINYAIQTECIRCDPGCCNNRIRTREYAKLAVKETPGKGHGLFAAEDLRKQQFLREYVGELISPEEFSRRSSDKKNPSEHQYIMQLKNGVYLDASRKGSISRFINHSCEPNCFVEIWSVQGHLRVGIFSMCSIPAGTELTFDYKWRRSARPPTRCCCGTEYCRGYLEIMSAEEIEALKVRKGQWRIGGELLSTQLKRSKTGTAGLSHNVSFNGAGGLSTSTTALSLESPRNTDSHSQQSQSPELNEPLSESKLSRESSAAELSMDAARVSPTTAVPASNTTGSASAEVLENDIYDSHRRLIPSKLIGKRVKVWWQGNLAFLEADVESYNPKTNKYLCKYEVDGSFSEEDFGHSVGSKVVSSTTSGATNGTASSGSDAGIGAVGVATGAAAAPAVTAGEGRSSVSGLSGNNGVQWKWLDETAEEIVIKKKTNPSDDLLSKDYEVVSSGHDSSHISAPVTSFASFQKSADTGSGFTLLNVTDRCVESIAPGVVRFVADMYAPGSELSKTAVFTSVTHYSAFQNFQQICQLNFSVRATQSTPSGADQSGTTQVIMYGQTEKLATVRELLREAKKALQLGGSSEDKHLRRALLNRQGVLLTKDWRFKPEKCTDKASTDPTKRSAAFQEYLEEKLKTLPDLSCLNCLPFDYLPSGISADSGTEVTENVRKSLLVNMQGLSARLGFSTQASMNAFMLLLRCLRFPQGNARENTSVLAAVALVVAKLHGEFRHKMTKTIVKSAYCQVFSRDESDITDESVVPYIEAALIKERLVFARVQNDVFSADIVPSLQAFVRTGLWADKWCLDNDSVINESSGDAVTNSGSKDKHKDREAEKLKRKKTATFEYESNIRNTVRRSVLNNGELLSMELLYVYSTSGSGGLEGPNGATNQPACAMVLCCLPVELLQLSCLVFVSLLSAFLPSGAEHKRVLSEIQAFTSALIATAASLGCAEALLQWCLEVVAEACGELLPRLEHLACFAELVDLYSPQDTTQFLRVTAHSGLVHVRQISEAAEVHGDQRSGDDQGRAPLHQALSAPAPPGRPTSPPRSSPRQQSPRSGKHAALLDSDVPYKARLPWLSAEDSSLDSALNVSCAVKLSDFQDGRYVAERQSNCADGDSLVAITKDVFFGFASLETNSAKFLPPLTVTAPGGAGTGTGASEVDVGLMSLRTWPSHGQVCKELKRAVVDDVNQLGLLPGPLSELTLLQHLHYMYHTAPDASPELLTSGECPYFVAPVGIMNLSASDLEGNNGLRGTILGVDTGTDEQSGANDNVSLKHGDPARKDNVFTLASLNADRKASVARTPEVFIPPVEFDLQFLAFPAVHVSLSTILGLLTPPSSPRWELTRTELEATPATAHVVKVLQVNHGHMLSPALAVELCKDLLCAVAHMVSCGVYLRWLNVEHIYVTPAGRLQVGGLSGASFATAATSSFKSYHSPATTVSSNGATGTDEENLSISVLAEQLRALRNQRSDTHTSGAAGAVCGDKSHRVKAKKYKFSAYTDEDDEEGNNSHTEKLRRVAKKLALPKGALYTVAPEVILGGPASPESSVFTVAAVCAQILSGKALIKNASSEDKQMQYIYKVLGTPKPMGFIDFDALPLALLYGRHIQEDNSDCRSRASRVFKEQCPPPLLQCFSFSHPQPLPQLAPARTANMTDNGAVSLTTVRKVVSQSDTDHEGVVDLVRLSMQLAPQRRLPVDLLLQFALFRQPVSALTASLSACNSGHKTRPELQSQRLRVGRGAQNVCIHATALTNKSRLNGVEELVTSLRAIQRVKIPAAVQKKDIYYLPVCENDLIKLTQMDALLFRLEREKYRDASKFSAYEVHRDNKTRDVSPGKYSSGPPPITSLPVPSVDCEAYSYGNHNNSSVNYVHPTRPYGYGAAMVLPRPPVLPAYPSDGYNSYSANYNGSSNYGPPSAPYAARIEPAYTLTSAPLHSAYRAPAPPVMPNAGVSYPRPMPPDSATKRGFYPSDASAGEQDSKKPRSSPN